MHPSRYIAHHLLMLDLKVSNENAHDGRIINVKKKIIINARIMNIKRKY